MIKRIVSSLSVAALVASMTVPVGAQLQSQPNGQILEITPVRQDVTISRGASVTRDVTVTNRNVGPVSLKTSFETIRASGDDGGTVATTDDVPWNLKQYAVISDATFTLAPGASRKVSVTITIPASGAPGGYYGQLKFTPTLRTDLPPVAVNGEIAELFLVRVPGPAKEMGNIQDFQLNRSDGSKIGGFFIGNDGYFLSRFHNGGNVHFLVEPKVSASNQFGKVVFQSTPTGQNVFPQGDRRFESKWSKISTGYYRATLTADLPGQSNAQRTIHFLVVTPLFAAITLLVLIALIVALTIHRRRRRRRMTAV